MISVTSVISMCVCDVCYFVMSLISVFFMLLIFVISVMLVTAMILVVSELLPIGVLLRFLWCLWFWDFGITICWMFKVKSRTATTYHRNHNPCPAPRHPTTPHQPPYHLLVICVIVVCFVILVIPVTSVSSVISKIFVISVMSLILWFLRLCGLMISRILVFVALFVIYMLLWVL